jgi:hypothetical protein
MVTPRNTSYSPQKMAESNSHRSPQLFEVVLVPQLSKPTNMTPAIHRVTEMILSGVIVCLRNILENRKTKNVDDWYKTAVRETATTDSPLKYNQLPI